MRNFKQVDEKYSFTLDNKQIAFLAAGALALFLLFFVMGVLYGKGLGNRGSQPAARGPAAPSADAADKSPAAEAAPPASQGRPGEKVFQLEEENIPSGGTSNAPKGRTAGARTEPALSPSAPAASPSHPASAVPKTSAQSSVSPPQAKGLKGVRLANMKGNYTIQVASFTSPADAKKLAKELEGNGYPAYTTQAHIRGRIYYRVRIGRFPARSEASAVAAAFKQAEKKDAIPMVIE